jgi:hypothetical protein
MSKQQQPRSDAQSGLAPGRAYGYDLDGATPLMSPKSQLMVMIASVLLIASAPAFAAPLQTADSGAAAANHQPSETKAVSDLNKTLDPMQFTGEVREAYKIARENPDLLAQLHCYCGCDRTDGHKNLLDCYRSTHAASCNICTGEVLEAKKLFDQGASLDTIREALRARFAGTDSN